MKTPQNTDKYLWTRHAFEKMRFYGIAEGRVKRIIRFPKRTEEAIVPGMVAVMQPASVKKTTAGKPAWNQEIWVMYKLEGPKGKKKIKIITAWRYPGKSPERDPVPKEIIEEVRKLL